MINQTPPLFKQGMPAPLRLLVCGGAALALLVTDARYDTLSSVRAAVATVLYPLEQLMLLPRQALHSTVDYVASKSTVNRNNAVLRAQYLDAAQQAQRNDALQAENRQLRTLLELKQATPLQAVAAEVDFEAQTPYHRRVVIDKGAQQGIPVGAPVIDERGVIGQITRVLPLQSEVTLIVDRDQAIPVLSTRAGLRGIIGGNESGELELRFTAASADVAVGDLFVTSGLDGVYPPGLPVAQVVRIDRRADASFAQIVCRPVAGVNRHRQLLVLEYTGPTLAIPDDAEPAPTGKRKRR